MGGRGVGGWGVVGVCGREFLWVGSGLEGWEDVIGGRRGRGGDEG